MFSTSSFFSFFAAHIQNCQQTTETCGCFFFLFKFAVLQNHQSHCAFRSNADRLVDICNFIQYFHCLSETSSPGRGEVRVHSLLLFSALCLIHCSSKVLIWHRSLPFLLRFQSVTKKSDQARKFMYLLFSNHNFFRPGSDERERKKAAIK